MGKNWSKNTLSFSGHFFFLTIMPAVYFILFFFLFLRRLISLFAGFSGRWRYYPRNITIARILKGLFLISKDITVTGAFSDNRQCYSLTKDYPFLALHIIT